MGCVVVFIPDRVLAGWWRSQWKASDRMGAGRCTTGYGRGQVGAGGITVVYWVDVSFS